MAERRTAARLARGADRLVPVALIAALALLCAGLWFPVMTVQSFFVFSSGFSILESIRALYEAQEYLLFAAVLLFSVVFPIFKLATCLAIWWLAEIDGAASCRLAAAIDQLGRWSMLDVFLLAILLVTVRTASLGGASTNLGLYLFASAVIVSMLGVHWLGIVRRRLASDR
jgi:paraquat-inducible protein A